jgi:hypothetical protein
MGSPVWSSGDRDWESLLMAIGYGVCVGSWNEFTSHVAPFLGNQSLYSNGGASYPIIALGGQTSIAVAYNTILDGFEKRWPYLQAVVLMHTDLEITDPLAEQKILNAVEWPNVALVGVAGGGGTHGTMWWSDKPVGHQWIDTGLIDFGTREGDVEVLEGSLLAFSPWAVKHLRFDESLPGFHGYDEIALQATRGHGKRCVVIDLDTHHHTKGGFKGLQSEQDWHAARQQVMEKWSAHD